MTRMQLLICDRAKLMMPRLAFGLLSFFRVLTRTGISAPVTKEDGVREAYTPWLFCLSVCLPAVQVVLLPLPFMQPMHVC